MRVKGMIEFSVVLRRVVMRVEGVWVDAISSFLIL